MAQAIVNLAIPVIHHKVKEVLETYPESPYQHVFSSTKLREKLVTYVLSRMPALYTTTDEARACLGTMPMHCFSREQQIQIDQLIRTGIQHLMTQQQTWETVSHAPPVTDSPSPSTWFG